ncbi:MULTISPECIES: sensor histidine kinase [unclassified Fusibacter]|uniref:ATP-binding protein n=1 Tax=unclassified Fusibacter TaxID=2624464 RepID=UPI001013345E|nr:MULTISPECIES: sensor histidine kinase [unclassified Fusibacter]MCK8059164.1 sensor histidine kinase [Fusibacter sp. A2]NPE22573.1 sensor histidine kinase [Fusibacter sp. A1]RXV60675.1 sensor histidine kinase [Fusibacter sp. A1]
MNLKFRRLNPIKLQLKLTILIMFLIVFSTGISSYFVSRFEFVRLEEKIESDLYNVAGIIADTPLIQKNLYEKNEQAIQQYVEHQLESLIDVEIITIADMEGIRFGHPNSDRLGERFVGGDELKVISEGAKYTSVATGTLGRSVRAFAPVYYQNEQVGFVMAAHLFDDVLLARRNVELNIIIYTLIGIVFGSMGAIVIAIIIKDNLLGLEPHEIVQLYREKNAMLKSLHEGILAIDDKGLITMMNDSAIKILGIKDTDVVGKHINLLFPTSKLLRVLETGVAEYDRGQKINGAHVMTNRVPVLEGNRIVGAIGTFRDRTEVVAMAEEITGVKQIIEALRANTHEFMNKLHVIMGLLEMGDDSSTKAYIIDLKESHDMIHEMVVEKIGNPMISALLLGKLNRAKEESVKLYLSEDSSFKQVDDRLGSQVVIIIIGNLIENAIEAIKRSNQSNGMVDVYLNDLGPEIIIQVTDNGVGIEASQISRIFRRGYSTKPGSNGIGLDIVNANVIRLGGKIEVDSEVGEGSTFTVTFPVEEI